ncbi:MAG: cell division protein SepF [Lachnospiraceae bacterium]|jgi:cell division inhibitor SepF|nr:cell division protein SepF [Lachnospiraceae bacterium]
MGFLSKLREITSLNDDEYDDLDEDLYEEEDDPIDIAPKKSFFSGIGKSKRDVDLDDEDDLDDIRDNRHSNVSSIRRHGTSIYVSKPTSTRDDEELIDMFKSKKVIILNLEGIDLAVGQRIIDHVGGAVYALNGKLKFITQYILIITPDSISVEGDYMDDEKNSSKIGFNY